MKRARIGTALLFLWMAAFFRLIEYNQQLATVALAALAAVFGLLLIFHIVRRVRNARLAMLTKIWMQRKERGQCLRCGYDLRATPSQCPECGALQNYGF